MGQKGFKEGDRQGSVAAWMGGLGRERRRLLPWLTPRSLVEAMDGSAMGILKELLFREDDFRLRKVFW